MATTNTIPDPEPDYSRFTDNMLDDDLWAELPLEEQRRLVSGLRSRTLHALGMAKEGLNDYKLTPEERRELRRRRVRTSTFLELIYERGNRIKVQAARENMTGYHSEMKSRYARLHDAVRAHQAVTTNPDSSDAELDAADRRLYAELDNPTEKEN